MQKTIRREFYLKLRRIENYKEICKLQSLYFQHGKTTVLKHCKNVAYYSLLLAKKLDEKFNISFNYNNLIIGAFLHDLFLYDWHEKDKSHRLHGYRHPLTASINAKRMCHINEEVEEIIKTHMWAFNNKKDSFKQRSIYCMLSR